MPNRDPRRQRSSKSREHLRHGARPEPPPEFGEVRTQSDRGEADPRADKDKGAATVLAKDRKR
jgi:hypothetical protein